MKVNSEKFVTYDLDNQNTIHERIAFKYGVLPKFVYVKTTKDSDDITAVNLLSLISKAKVDNMKSLYDKNKDKFDIKPDDYCFLWYIYNVQPQNDEYITHKFSELIEKEFSVAFQRIVDNYKDYHKALEIETEKFSGKIQTQVDNMKELQNKKPMYSTHTEVIKTILQIEFTVDYDIYELFNELQMTREIPFCVIGKLHQTTSENAFYKVLKEFKPPEMWKYIQTRGETLHMKVLNVLNEPAKNRDSPQDIFYSNVSIKFESSYDEAKRKLIESKLSIIEDEEKKESVTSIINSVKVGLRGLDFPPISRVYMTLESVIHQELDEKLLIQRILNLFPSKINDWKSEQIKVSGVFYVPELKLDFPIFLDVITNNDIFSDILAVDERRRLPKEEYGIQLQFLYSNMQFNLDTGIVQKGNLKLMARDPKLQAETHYVKLFIMNAKNVLEIERFKLILCKLFNMYNNPKEDIKKRVIERYDEYIDFEEYLEREAESIKKIGNRYVRKNKLLKDVNPDQFIAGYARLCQHAPRIVVEKTEDDGVPLEVQELEDQDYQVMLFPNKPEDGKQYYYACDSNSKYSFPALKRNMLSNNEKYPVVPCCYTSDHTTRKRSLWKKYFQDELSFNDLRSEHKGQKEDDTHVYVTGKILPNTRLGNLPKDIQMFFKNIDSTNNYMRRGVERSVNSVLDCLIFATDKDVSSDKLRKRLIKFIEKNNVNLSGEIPNFSLSNVRSYLEDENKYLSPHLFAHLLEIYFQCRIVLYVQNEVHPYGVLACPDYSQSYIQRVIPEDWPVICIYEHMGTEVDSAKYPQCELIVKTDKDGYESEYDPSLEVIKRMMFTFNEMYENVKEFEVEQITFKSEIISCGVDYYGKTRFVVLNYKKGVCVYTHPLPALDVPLKYEYVDVDSDIAQGLIKFEGLKSKNVVVNDFIVGYQTPKFYIPIVPIPHSAKKPTSFVVSPIGNFSLIQTYVNLERLSRLLTEYVLYLFSVYYISAHDENKVVDESFIKDFASDNIVIDSKFKYDITSITRSFGLKNGLLRDNKLVVPNEIVLKKLIYVLQVRLKNKNEVLNYCDYKFIPSYFNDIRDFKQRSGEIIIYKQRSFVKWMDERNNNYSLFDSLRINTNTLETELMKNRGKSNLSVVMFTAEWSKVSKLTENRIFDVLGKKKKYTDLAVQFPKCNFYYVDIDNNKSLASYYGISNVPYFILFKYLPEDKEYMIVDHVIGDETNIFENVKRLKTSIDMFY